MKENKEFNELIAAIGLKGERLARAIKLSRSSISQMSKGQIGIREETLNRVREVARQVTEQSIHKLEGTKARLGQHLPLATEDRPPGAVPLAGIKSRGVPVISWARAGEGGNYSDCADQIDEWVLLDCPDPNAYALIIEGDSMEPRYCAGDRAIFMPNHEPQNGNKVVARLWEDGQVYFKLFHRTGRDGKTIKLTSLNPAYPPFEHPISAFRFIHPFYRAIRT